MYRAGIGRVLELYDFHFNILIKNNLLIFEWSDPLGESGFNRELDGLPTSVSFPAIHPLFFSQNDTIS